MTDAENNSANQVFICPFNGYHKQFDYRKFQFHIARCKDKRGKTVYTCQFNPGHIYIRVDDLIAHEKVCTFRKTKLEPSADETMEESPSLQGGKKQTRLPTRLYCQYDEKHEFRTHEEREKHEQVCEKRSECEHKWAKSQAVYQRHKGTLKNGQKARQNQMDELFGHNNGPQARAMPTLHYKYRMNEPFVDGERGQYQVSHQQNDFKKKHVYGLDDSLKKAESQLKTTQEELDNMKQEINQELLGAFRDRDAPDIHTLMVKQDQSDLFGLRIANRSCPEVNHLFDYDIEEYISFLQLRQMFRLSEDVILCWTASQWQVFLRENTVMELSITESSEELNSQHTWGEIARNMLNTFSQSVIVNVDEAIRRTVLLNSTRGNALFKDGAEEASDLPHTKVTYLLMINRSTELIGQYLGSDFAILRLTTDLEVSKRNSPQSKAMRALLEPRNAHKSGAMVELEQEKQELESRLKEAQGEIAELQASAETNDKIIRDKERQARSDKKQIDFLENDKKQVRGELRQCQEMLNDKEIQVRNLERELEDLKKEIKSLQKRLETVRATSEQQQGKLVQTTADNMKLKEMLSGANKAIKLKDVQVQQKQQEIARLNGVIQKFSQLKDGKQMSMSAIRNLNDQPIVTVQVVGAQGQPTTDSQPPVKQESSQASKQEPEVVRESQTKVSGAEVEPEMEFGEVSDGEIMDGEEDKNVVMMNKVEQLAAEVARQREAQLLGEDSALSSKVKSNPEEETKMSGAASKAKVLDPTNIDNLPEDMICCICMSARKSVMIQTCKHLVFCTQCDRDYKLKNYMHQQCPICRKEFKKTLQVLFV